MFNVFFSLVGGWPFLIMFQLEIVRFEPFKTSLYVYHRYIYIYNISFFNYCMPCSACISVPPVVLWVSLIPCTFSILPLVTSDFQELVCSLAFWMMS